MKQTVYRAVKLIIEDCLKIKYEWCNNKPSSILALREHKLLYLPCASQVVFTVHTIGDSEFFHMSFFIFAESQEAQCWEGEWTESVLQLQNKQCEYMPWIKWKTKLFDLQDTWWSWDDVLPSRHLTAITRTYGKIFYIKCFAKQILHSN